MKKINLLYRQCVVMIVVAFLLPNPAFTSQDHALTTGIDHPILFVTQAPVADGFTGIVSTFGNHLGNIKNSGRGGDLWIWYPDGTMKNLTALAGYGVDTNDDGILTGDEAIGVRDPSVHWSGEKALFSMVIGAPTAQYQVQSYYWQIYEITGLGTDDTPTITKISNQPPSFNNITPIYGSDDHIIFTSDRPRNGSPLLYPQLDEYELAPTVSGIWSLDPATGDLQLLNHAPSGDFTPTIDSYGRIVFTQWDHLQRDQQADSDQENIHPGSTECGNSRYGTFNYASEDSSDYDLTQRREVFPEPRACRTDLLAGTNLSGNNFNHFFPWSINQDGSESEILSHMGRHEFGVYIEKAITDDPNVMEFYGQYGHTENENIIRTGVFQIKEDPNNPGRYFGIDTPEFGTHASGNIVRINAPLGVSADNITIDYITHPDTYFTNPTANHSGRYRDPLILSNGTLIAVHSPYIGEENGSNLNSAYSFRVKVLSIDGSGYYMADQLVTSGITKSISYWNPDNLVTYSGQLWELSPVEVRPRIPPSASAEPSLNDAEQSMFDEAGVDVTEFRQWLDANNLALVVGRNVTTRDDLDKQQPFNLRIPNGIQTIGTDGKVYDVTHIQFFQGDQLRGLTGCCDTIPNPGRRVIAQVMHDISAVSAMPDSNGPDGSAKLASDGSFAAFVPSQRAMSWQLTKGGEAVVRERYWVTFQPGEIRVCTSCHGLNEYDQAGNLEPQNHPQALLALLLDWKGNQNPQTHIPVLVYPTNADHLLSLRLTFDWDDFQNALSYSIQISKNNTFTNLVKSTSVLSSSYPINFSLPANKILYWRVRAKTAKGLTDWSEVRSFTTPTPPSTPALVAPAFNSLNKNYTPLFKWKPVSLPTGTQFQHYHLQLDNNSDFSSPEINDTSATDRLMPLFQVIAPLSPNTKYYWRVRGVNTAGEAGNWSVVRSIRTALLIPDLLTPVNDNMSSINTRIPLFSWSPVNGATTYTIQVSTNASFSTLLINATISTPSYQRVTAFPRNRTFYWRVRTNGVNGPSSWSPTFTFKTP